MNQRRTLSWSLLLTALVWAVSGSAQPRFVPSQTLELPHDVHIGLDGAGGAQVSWRGEVVASLELMVVGDVDAPARFVLDVAHGADLPRTDLIEIALGEGQAGGVRGADDDGDGRIDEDPFDGLDNDGDGARDEDFGAIGHEMHVSVATLDAAGLPGTKLRGRWSHWPYFHVDDVLFWNAGLELEGPVREGAPGVRIRSAYPVTFSTETIEPHATLGKAQSRRVQLAHLRAEDPDGRRFYLAVVRLDGRPGEILPEGDGIVWDSGAEIRWPLALVTAPTRDALQFSVAQALLTYRASAEQGPSWTVPPLCARCQNTNPLKAHLRLTEEGEELAVTLRTEGHDAHLRVSPEGTAIAGTPLAPYLVRARASSADYRLPLDLVDARAIVAAALTGNATVTLVLHNGLEVTPTDLDAEIDPALGTVAAETEADSEFPRHLAPHLLQSWPNPFHETTTIRFEVPATLGDAFDFEPDDERVQKLDLEAEPPFGPNPIVRVRVYNVGGQLIRILDENVRRVGRHSVSWDGADDQGMPVAAGAYYVNVEMGDYRVTRRILRLKP